MIGYTDDLTAICFALTSRKHYIAVLDEKHIQFLFQLLPLARFNLCLKNHLLGRPNNNHWTLHSAASQQLYTWIGNRCIYCRQTMPSFEKRKSLEEHRLTQLGGILESPRPSLDSRDLSRLEGAHQRLQRVVIEVESILQKHNAASRFLHRLEQLFDEFATEWEESLCFRHCKGSLAIDAEEFICYYRHKWDDWEEIWGEMVKISARRRRLARILLVPFGKFIIRHRLDERYRDRLAKHPILEAELESFRAQCGLGHDGNEATDP
jgi:hypothetical protein